MHNQLIFNNLFIVYQQKTVYTNRGSISKGKTGSSQCFREEGAAHGASLHGYSPQRGSQGTKVDGANAKSGPGANG